MVPVSWPKQAPTLSTNKQAPGVGPRCSPAAELLPRSSSALLVSAPRPATSAPQQASITPARFEERSARRRASKAPSAPLSPPPAAPHLVNDALHLVVRLRGRDLQLQRPVVVLQAAGGQVLAEPGVLLQGGRGAEVAWRVNVGRHCAVSVQTTKGGPPPYSHLLLPNALCPAAVNLSLVQARLARPTAQPSPASLPSRPSP